MPCSTGSVTSFVDKHRLPLGLAAALGCLAVAGIWLRVVPAEADDAEGVVAFILRYGHSIVWMLFAATAVLVAWRAPRRWWHVTAAGAGLTYGAFVAALVA